MRNDKFAFISDFNGTLTNEEFYQMIIDDYLGEEGTDLLKDWKQNEYKDKKFLDKVYSTINKSENEIIRDVLKIEWDKSAKGVIKKIQKSGGEFIIISSGTSSYINKLLKENDLSGIKVYSNSGKFIDEEEDSYSDSYGIDKSRLVNDLKEIYSYVYYAGDSATDILPCKIADACFAKGALQEMLKNERVDFIPINSFEDVERYLIEEGRIQ